MTYTIADMCKAGRTTQRGVRFWEQRGLLGEVERVSNRYRRYTAEQIKSAKIIAACQLVGMSIDEIRGTLENYSRSEIVEKLVELRAEARAVQAALPTSDPEFDL